MPRLLGPIDCAYITYKSKWVSKEEEEEVEEEVEGREREELEPDLRYAYGKDETMIVHDQQHIRLNMLKPNNHISEKMTNDQPIIRIGSFTLSYLRNTF